MPGLRTMLSVLSSPHIHGIVNLRSELQEIYLNRIIYNFAHTLVGIFVAIYLLELGYSLSTVILYFAAFWISMLVFAALAGKLSHRIGGKHTILVSAVLVILYFLFLLLLQSRPAIEWVFALAVFGGLAAVHYWVPLNTDFVLHSKKLHTGSEVSNLIALPSIATIAAPFIGSVILASMGFSILFVIVMFLMFVSVWPLFLTREHRAIFSFNIRSVFGWRGGLSSAAKINTGFTGVISVVEMLLWPVLVFFIFGDLVVVGIAGTLSVAGIGVFTLVIGRVSDRLNKAKVLKAGAAMIAVVWALRGFASTPMEVVILSFLGGMAAILVDLPVFSLFVEEAKRAGISSSILAREYGLGSTRAVLAILVATPFVGVREGLLLASAAAVVFFVYQLAQRPEQRKLF